MDTVISQRVSSPARPPEHRLHKEMGAAKVLREQIADVAAGDPEFIRDTIEGETSLHEMISAVAASLLEDTALADGIARLTDDLETRKERILARAETKRALIASAMEIGELAKIETPAATISVRPVPPKALIIEEADIPARFWEPAPPKLNKRAILDALKERQAAIADALSHDEPGARSAALDAARAAHPEIPGAALSNGARTISIRVK